MKFSFHALLLLVSYYNYFSSQEGRVAPDNSIGRFISETVSSLPKLSPPAFDKLVNDSLQVTKCIWLFSSKRLYIDSYGTSFQ